MTDTPSPKPNEPTGESPERGSEQFAAQPGQHESADPQPQEPGAEHGRHEMAGPAGYPQFEGPGAAQYGNEPVESPPPATSSSLAPGHPGQQPQQGQAPQQGYPPQQGQPQQGYPPQYGQPAGQPSQPSYGPPGSMPPGPMAPQMPPGSMPPPGTPQPSAPAQSHPTYGYQGALQTPGTLDVGNALSYGWARFGANIAPWLGITAVGLVIYLAFVLIVRVVNPQSLFTLVLIFLVVMVAIWLLQAAMIRGALYETDGNKPTFASYFHFVNAGNVLLTALLAFALTWIGAALCLVPGLVAGFLCMFALHFVVDQDQGPIDAIKSSARLVITNFGQTLLLAIAVLVITCVATLLCGFGLLVAGPVCTIAVTYAYRTLTGGTVAAL